MEVPPVLSVLLKEAELKHIDLKPNSVVVIRLESPLSAQNRQNIFEVMKNIFPNNKVLILDHDSQLDVVTPKDEEPKIAAQS